MYVGKNIFFYVQPPRSPDLSPSNFYLWGQIKTSVYSAIIENKERFHQRIFLCLSNYSQPPWDLEMVHQFMIRRVHACTDSGGRHFEDLL